MVKKLIVVAVFMSLNIDALANDSVVSANVVDATICYPQKQNHIPFDSVVAGFDRLMTVSQELVGTVKDGMKSDGVAVYIRKHMDVFSPFIAFVLLYGVWLKRRKP